MKRQRNPTNPNVGFPKTPHVGFHFVLPNLPLNDLRSIAPHHSEVSIVIVALSTTAFLLSIALTFKGFLQLLVVMPPVELTQPHTPITLPKP